MNILFIHPPNSKNSIGPGRLEPLGLEVLAATIPGHHTKILDMRIDGLRELERQMDSFRPEIIGITVNNTIHVRQSIKLLNRIRNKHPKIKLLVGGHHPTVMPQDFHLPSVDFIFLGWAEKSFPEFIQCMCESRSADQIPGIEILENGNVVSRKENLWNLKTSQIPFPKRELVSKYRKHYRSDLGFSTALVNTSRGCGNRCVFCSVWNAADGNLLIRNPDDVFHEIAAVPENIHRIFFADDNTFIRTDFAARLCQLIRDAGIEKKYSGYCRSDTIIKNPGLMQDWKNIGLDNLCVGMEATDNLHLEKYNKKNDISNNENASRILNEIGIPFRPHFLIDPLFEQADFKRIETYVQRLRLKSPIFPILTPVPGSLYYEEMKDQIILDYDHFDYAHAVTPTRMTPDMFYKEWKGLFFKSYPILKSLLCYFRKQVGRLRGNQRVVQENYHYKLLNLFILNVVGIFLSIKIRRHCRALKSGSLQLTSVK